MHTDREREREKKRSANKLNCSRGGGCGPQAVYNNFGVMATSDSGPDLQVNAPTPLSNASHASNQRATLWRPDNGSTVPSRPLGTSTAVCDESSTHEQWMPRGTGMSLGP